MSHLTAEYYCFPYLSSYEDFLKADLNFLGIFSLFFSLLVVFSRFDGNMLPKMVSYIPLRTTSPEKSPFSSSLLFPLTHLLSLLITVVGILLPYFFLSSCTNMLQTFTHIIQATNFSYDALASPFNPNTIPYFRFCTFFPRTSWRRGIHLFFPITVSLF